MLRPADVDRDLPAVARLWCMHHREAITPEDMRDRFVNWPPHLPVLRLVWEEDGQVIGFARTGKMGATTSYMTDVAVREDSRRRGIGQALFAPLEEFARETGAENLSTSISETADEGIQFAFKNGFKVRSTLIRSRCDLAQFDGAQWPMPDGFTLTSLAERGGDQAERAFCDAYAEADADTPDIDDFGLMDWETFRASILGAHWFNPSLAVYALRDGDVAGVTVAIPPSADTPTEFHTEFTGIRRAYRGVGLAHALKAAVLDRCKAMGGESIVTHNDHKNAGMLAVNQKLGFVPTSTRSTLIKSLAGEQV